MFNSKDGLKFSNTCEIFWFGVHDLVDEAMVDKVASLLGLRILLFSNPSLLLYLSNLHIIHIAPGRVVVVEEAVMEVGRAISAVVMMAIGAP
jgi:hypothetical protein